MRPEQIQAAREAMGMTISGFAFWLGLEGEHGRRKVRALESGKEAPTGPIRRAIKLGRMLARIREVLADQASGLLDSREDAIEEIERILGSDEPGQTHTAGASKI